jgi:hypothetical protein
MAETPVINTVESEDDYIHVQFREPNRFGEIRTPDWAANAAQSVSDGPKSVPENWKTAIVGWLRLFCSQKASVKTKPKSKRRRLSKKSNPNREWPPVATLQFRFT